MKYYYGYYGNNNGLYGGSNKLYIITNACVTKAEAESEFYKAMQRIKKEHKDLYWEFYGKENGVFADTEKRDIEPGYVGRIAVLVD